MGTVPPVSAPPQRGPLRKTYLLPGLLPAERLGTALSLAASPDEGEARDPGEKGCCWKLCLLGEPLRSLQNPATPPQRCARFTEVSGLLLMQRRLQKGVLAFTADRPITRVKNLKCLKKASEQIFFLLSTLPSHCLCCYFPEGLNAEYVKGENMEAVVSEEPQGERLASLPLPLATEAASPRDSQQAPRAVPSCRVSLVPTPPRRCRSLPPPQWFSPFTARKGKLR